MIATGTGRSPRFVYVAGSVLLLALFAFCFVTTFHWKVVMDQSVFHYIRFLMSRGYKPYTDITDMNLPGCYLAEMAAMAVFGWSDVSWRMYEFSLFAVFALGAGVIGGRRRWFVGIFATATFMPVVLALGEEYALERDEVMAVLCVTSLALFLLSVRRRSPPLLAAFAAVSGFAALMKPTGMLLQIALLLLLAARARQHKFSLWPYLGWAALGDTLVGALLIGFFLRTHSFAGFVFVITKVWPLYSQTAADTIGQLTLALIPKPLLALVLCGLLAAWLNRRQAQWSRGAILLGLAVGALIFYSQLRTAAYHRTTFVAFLALWVGFEVTLLLESSLSRTRQFGFGLCVLLFALIDPYYVRLLHRQHQQPSVYPVYAASIQHDLDQLGGPRLQGEVECLDMVDGCLRALYQSRLVQNTGSTGDMLLFTPQPSPAATYYRNWYTGLEQQHPAEVVVVSNRWYQSVNRSFRKLDAWPAYAAILRSEYTMVAERYPAGFSFGPGYRIYVRNGSPALAAAQALQRQP